MFGPSDLFSTKYLSAAPSISVPYVLTAYCAGDEYALNTLKKTEGISADRREFILKLLEPDPNRRPTATVVRQEIWVHEWLTKKKQDLDEVTRLKQRCKKLEEVVQKAKFTERSWVNTANKHRKLLDERTHVLRESMAKEKEKKGRSPVKALKRNKCPSGDGSARVSN